MTAPTLVAVTGATGFVGTHLMVALRERGIPARAIVRRPGLVARGPVVNEAVAPLDDREALRRALAGADVLIHLAGRAHVMRESTGDPAAEFHRVNVDGTRLVVEEAIRAGVTRVVYLSSIGAIATTSAAPVSDATPPAPDSVYGRSKLESEQVVRELCDAAAVDYAILRPPMVFGPGMKGNPLRLFHLVSRGMPVPLGLVRNQRSLIYVENLAQAILRTIAMPAGIRDTWVLGDGAPLSSAALVREVAGALGAPARLLPVPPSLMRLAGRVGDQLARVVPFPLTSDTVERLFGSLAVDYSRFARDAGYVPAVARDDAMRRSAEWFRSGAR